MEKSRAIVIGVLLKVDVGNPNAGWPEGVVTVLKKVELPVAGKVHPYISGQALRRYLRDTLEEILPSEEKFSPLLPGDDPKSPVVTEGNPREYIDDDLFGFMRAIKAKTKRRASPLRVSPAFGLFPYTGDRDLGTRSAVEVLEEAEAGGSIFETEVTNNVFRSTILLEIDRVGKWKLYETIDEGKKNLELESAVRMRRVILLLEALKYLWGGGRRSRMLVDLSPQFIIYARMTRKLPIFLQALMVSMGEEGYTLNTSILDEVIKDYKPSIKKLIIGLRRGFLANDEEISTWAKGKANTYSVGEAVDKMIEDIKGTEF